MNRVSILSLASRIDRLYLFWSRPPRLWDVTAPEYDALTAYIENTSEPSPALADARADAAEFGLPVPDEVTGQLLSTLAATAGREGSGAVAVTPAAGVVGLYLLAGLPAKATLTCIDPEATHHNKAKRLFRQAGHSVARMRFLPSRPLDVMGRLANGSYQLVYLDVPVIDLPVVLESAWPLLSAGGTLIMVDCLLDGTIAEEDRHDRETLAARQAQEMLTGFEDALVTHLPLGAGMTLVTRRN